MGYWKGYDWEDIANADENTVSLVALTNDTTEEGAYLGAFIRPAGTSFEACISQVLPQSYQGLSRETAYRALLASKGQDKKDDLGRFATKEEAANALYQTIGWQ